MFKKDDLIDAIIEALGRRANSVESQDPRPLTRDARRATQDGRSGGRIFLSEFEIRRRLTGDARELRIPKGAIISPLALDWLSLKGIIIVEE